MDSKALNQSIANFSLIISTFYKKPVDSDESIAFDLTPILQGWHIGMDKNIVIARSLIRLAKMLVAEKSTTTFNRDVNERNWPKFNDKKPIDDQLKSSLTKLKKIFEKNVRKRDWNDTIQFSVKDDFRDIRDGFICDIKLTPEGEYAIDGKKVEIKPMNAVLYAHMYDDGYILSGECYLGEKKCYSNRFEKANFSENSKIGAVWMDLVMGLSQSCANEYKGYERTAAPTAAESLSESISGWLSECALEIGHE